GAWSHHASRAQSALIDVLLADTFATGLALGHALVLAIGEHAKVLDGPDLVVAAAQLLLVAIEHGDRLVGASLLDLHLRGLLAIRDDLLDVVIGVATRFGELLAPLVEIGAPSLGRVPLLVLAGGQRADEQNCERESSKSHTSGVART